MIEQLNKYRNMPLPERVLWNAKSKSTTGALLSAGEVGLFGSAGGLGKSLIAIDIARAATVADKPTTVTCGLGIRSGPVVILNYEDSPVRMANRLERMGGGDRSFERIHIVPALMPLFHAGPKPGQVEPSGQWQEIWEEVAKIKPSLMIIDPATAALADVPISEGAAVRRFLRELSAQAAELDVGVLIIAHDNKATRDATAAGFNPGAGAIAGSAQWYDASRAVLHMTRHPIKDSLRMIQCLKSNYGPSQWGIEVAEKNNVYGDFVGFEYSRHLSTGDIVGINKDARRKARQSKADKKPDTQEPDTQETIVANDWMNNDELQNYF